MTLSVRPRSCCGVGAGVSERMKPPAVSPHRSPWRSVAPHESPPTSTDTSVCTVTAPRARVSEVYGLSARLTELRPEGWGGDGIHIIGDRRKPRRNGCRCPSATPVSPHGDVHAAVPATASGGITADPAPASRAAVDRGLRSSGLLSGNLKGRRRSGRSAPGHPGPGLTSEIHKPHTAATTKPPTDPQHGHWAHTDTSPKGTDGSQQTRDMQLNITDPQRNESYNRLTPTRMATPAGQQATGAGEDAGRGPRARRRERRRHSLFGKHVESPQKTKHGPAGSSVAPRVGLQLKRRNP